MLKAIDTTATVSEDGLLVIKLPPDIPPGQHRVVLVIGEAEKQATKPLPLNWIVYPVGLVSDTFTFRREELYGDNGH